MLLDVLRGAACARTDWRERGRLCWLHVKANDLCRRGRAPRPCGPRLAAGTGAWSGQGLLGVLEDARRRNVWPAGRAMGRGLQPAGVMGSVNRQGSPCFFARTRTRGTGCRPRFVGCLLSSQGCQRPRQAQGQGHPGVTRALLAGLPVPVWWRAGIRHQERVARARCESSHVVRGLISVRM